MATPPNPPAPPSPTLPPVPPCTAQNFIIDCTAGGVWLTGETQKPVVYVNNVTVWVEDRLDEAEAALAGEFTFTGIGGNTTIHVHDDVTLSQVHNTILFVVEGGPAGAQWTCRHTCVVPDTSIVVSLNPLKVPPEDWFTPTAAFPPPLGNDRRHLQLKTSRPLRPKFARLGDSGV